MRFFEGYTDTDRLGNFIRDEGSPPSWSGRMPLALPNRPSPFLVRICNRGDNRLEAGYPQLGVLVYAPETGRRPYRRLPSGGVDGAIPFLAPLASPTAKVAGLNPFSFRAWPAFAKASINSARRGAVRGSSTIVVLGVVPRPRLKVSLYVKRRRFKPNSCSSRAFRR